jgi:membrane-associated phospholipid phosphatase
METGVASPALQIGSLEVYSSILLGASCQGRIVIMSKIAWRKAFGLTAACLVAGATVASVFFWDRQVTVLLHRAQYPPIVDVAALISVLGSPALYFIPSGIAFIYFKCEDRKRLPHNRALFLLLASTNSAFWTDALKFLVGRSRPGLLVDKSIYTLHPFSNNWGFNSFPSDHAAVAVAMAAVFSILIPAYKPTFVLLAVLVCACRVYIGAHYPSDVIAGSVIGIMTVLALRFIFDRCGIPLSPLRQHQP